MHNLKLLKLKSYCDNTVEAKTVHKMVIISFTLNNNMYYSWSRNIGISMEVSPLVETDLTLNLRLDAIFLVAHSQQPQSWPTRRLPFQG
jgi:hypothetical protein